MGFAAHGALASGFQSSQNLSSEAITQSSSSSLATQEALYIKEIEGAAKTYPRQKIVYKITKYSKEKNEMSDEEKNKEIKWAVKVEEGGNNIELPDKGEKITLDIDKDWESKDIFVMAYIENTEKATFKTKVLQDSFKGTLIRGVTGEDEASPEQEVEYKVTNSNKDGDAGKVDAGSDIKWAIKVSKNGSIDKKMLEGEKGKKVIVLKMKREWAGDEITVMPYLNSPTETVSVRTKVTRGNLRTKLGETHYKAVNKLIESTNSLSKVAFRKFEKELFVNRIDVPVEDIEYNYLEKELNLNIKADKEGFNENNEKEFEPYERTIHEIWHNIDHLAGPDSETFFSQTYKDKLLEAFNADFRDKVGTDVGVFIDDKANEDEQKSRDEFLGEYDFLSFYDIIDAATKGMLIYNTHKRDDWNDQTIPAEIFANIVAAEIANSEAFEVIKNKLSKTIEVYNDMLSDMQKSNSIDAR